MYKCFYPKHKKFLVSMDVTFCESQIFFITPLQGEYNLEESLFDLQDDLKSSNSDFVIRGRNRCFETPQPALLPETKRNVRAIDATCVIDGKLLEQVYSRNKCRPSTQDTILQLDQKSNLKPDPKATDVLNLGTQSETFLEPKSPLSLSCLMLLEKVLDHVSTSSF